MHYRPTGIPLLTIENLTKRYPGKNGVQANDGIDLVVNPGEVVGLLGHNGAGKTTLVNSIVGLIRPDSGTITLGGVDAIARPSQARRLAAVQAQTNVPIGGLTPREAISLVCRMRGMDKREAQARAEEMIEAFAIGPWADKPADKASGGIARLTAVSMTAAVPALLHIFDEPTNDVDPARRVRLWRHIRSMADDHGGVLLTTHNVREAAEAVDRVIILDHGKILAQGTVADIAAVHNTDNLEEAYLAIVGEEEGEAA